MQVAALVEGLDPSAIRNRPGIGVDSHSLVDLDAGSTGAALGLRLERIELPNRIAAPPDRFPAGLERIELPERIAAPTDSAYQDSSGSFTDRSGKGKRDITDFGRVDN